MKSRRYMWCKRASSQQTTTPSCPPGLIKPQSHCSHKVYVEDASNRNREGTNYGADNHGSEKIAMLLGLPADLCMPPTALHYAAVHWAKRRKGGGYLCDTMYHAPWDSAFRYALLAVFWRHVTTEMRAPKPDKPPDAGAASGVNGCADYVAIESRFRSSVCGWVVAVFARLLFSTFSHCWLMLCTAPTFEPKNKNCTFLKTLAIGATHSWLVSASSTELLRACTSGLEALSNGLRQAHTAAAGRCAGRGSPMHGFKS